MKSNKWVTVIAFVLLVLPMANSYAAKQASEKSIKELMQLTGSGNLGVQVMRNMLPALEKMLPKVPQSFWVDYMKGVNPDDLENLVIPIYQKYFTEKDIRNTIKFYQSPTGRKMIRVMPQIMQESMAAGQKWGQQLAQKAIERAREKKLLSSNQSPQNPRGN